MSDRSAISTPLFAGCLLGVIALLAGGCAAERQDLVVSVREAKGAAPRAGAGVKLTMLNPQHALRVGDYVRWLSPGERDGPTVLTDERGDARVRAPSDRPFLVTLILPGLVPESIPLREWDPADGPFPPTAWLPAPMGLEPPAEAEYEFRISGGA